MMLVLEKTPPYDFDLSANIFSDGDAQILRYEAGRYWQVVRVDGKLILIVVRSSGTIDDPRISVEIKPDDAASSKDVKMVGEVVTSILGLDLDLKPSYEDIKNDENLAKIVEKLRGLKSPTTQTVFEALIS